MELGVPVAIVEDHLLEHRILWEGSDTDAAVPVIEATRERFPELVACSFDRGFHSPQNQAALGDRLELNAMPAKGRRPASRREHEAQPDFVLTRQQHPAVESAINNLEQRSPDRAADGSPCPILPEISNMGAKIPARPPFAPECR